METKDIFIIFTLIIIGIVIIVVLLSIITMMCLNKRIKHHNLPVNSGPVRNTSYSNSTMNFIIINKMTKVSQQDILDVISATTIHMNNFSYYWGVSATFRLLNEYPSSDEILDGSSLIYLVDDVIGEHNNFEAIALHWMTLPSPDDTASSGGSQPNTLITGAPLVNVGVPIIMIPYGNAKYGLASKKGTNINIKDTLGEAFSHEIFETLINPYAGNGGSYQAYINNEEITLFVKEVCDPTENNTQVKINNISLSNFVTPDYFNYMASKNSLFDYLGLIKEPLKPFNGIQNGIVLNRLGVSYFSDSSINGQNVERIV